MIIKPEQLAAALQQDLAPVYLLAGEEALLLQECRDQVFEAGRRAGFLEREIFEADRNFDWEEFAAGTAERSLFSSRKIADIRSAGCKLGPDGGKFLARWAERPDPDVLLVLSCGEWNKATRKLAWVEQMAAAGVLVEIWPVRSRELPAWVAARFKARGMQVERDAVSLLVGWMEGNLLAIGQEIEKLALLCGERTVTADDVRRSAAESSIFTTFQLGEDLFAGQLAESLRVAAGLRRTGVSVQEVCGALCYQFELLEAFRQALRSGEDEKQTFGRLRVIWSMQAPLRRAAHKFSTARIGSFFLALAHIDRQGKGQAAGDPWQTLERALLAIAAEPVSRRVAAGQGK